jgi:hypothetical protein
MRRACIIWTVALCLAVCISVLFCSTESVGIQAATGSFTVPGPTPTPTPTPTIPPVTPTPSPSPTLTATPTVTPIPKPTTLSGGGSSNQPSISLKLHIDILGQKTDYLLTSSGKVLKDITATSADGKITLKISRGTFALDADGEPLTEIYITAVDPLLKAPPLTPPTDNYFIYIYKFLPNGASFSEPIEINVTYDPSDLPKSPDALTLQMYTLKGEPNEWEVLPKLSDIETNTVICSINHLSIYALIAAPLEEPTFTPQPMPAPTSSEPHTNGLILLILILPAASLTFFMYILLRWRRSNRLNSTSSTQ